MWRVRTLWALGLAVAIEEPADSAVETLTLASFVHFVLSHPFSVVEFYAPWCSQCKALAPKYRAAAARLRGKVAFGKMDNTNDENRRLRAGNPEVYNFTSYPTLTLFFHEDSSKSVGHQLLSSDGLYGPKRDALGNLWDRYYGGYETEEMVWWLTQMLEGKNPIVAERKVLKPGLYKACADNVDQGGNDTPAVLDVDSAGLNMIVNPRSDDNRLWVVEFYSDRCPHCKQLVPEVIKAAKYLKWSLGRSRIGFAAINARVFFEDAEKWGITGLPWVTAYYRGEKLPDMSGLSDANSIIQWTQRMSESYWRKKEGGVSASKASSASPYEMDEHLSIPGAHSLRTHVAELTLETFTNLVRVHPFSIVKFYAPWCEHCQAIAPKFEEAAKELNGKVAFGKVDDTHEGNRRLQAGSPGMYNFTHFPAFVLFFSKAFSESVGHQVLRSEGLLGPKGDKFGNLWDKYYGGTETEEIVWWLKQMLEGRNPIVEEREVLKPGLYKTYVANVEEGASSKPAVMDIDPVGFKAITHPSKDDNRLWIVEFYSDRCPYCRHLVPEVVEAAKRLKSTLYRTRIGFASINARVFYEETDNWGITGLPWLTAWYRGEKLEDMAGLSDASSIVRWATHMHQLHWQEKGGTGMAHTRGTLIRDSGLSSHDRLSHCINAGICACEDRPRCLCAVNPKLDGCCNMGCGSCEDICTALTENPPAEEEDDEEPPDLPTMPERTQKPETIRKLAVEIHATAVNAVTEATRQLPNATNAQNRAWRDELGSHTWFFLHTLAAKYPESPCEADKTAMRWQIALLAQLYPCTICRAHIRHKLLHDIEPVNVTDRATLSSWLCRLHNLVNTDLGKPLHECTLRALDAKYLNDCADCSIGARVSRGSSSIEQDRGPTFLAAAYAADPGGYIAVASSAHG